MNEQRYSQKLTIEQEDAIRHAERDAFLKSILEETRGKAMEGLTVGRMVHYVNHKTGKHMAAIVVHVWQSPGLVNLFVPPDSYEDREPLTPTSVQFDPGETGTAGRGPNRGTWHWIEKA